MSQSDKGSLHYVQRSGRLLYGGSACAWLIARCYAGAADGRNNPAVEHVRDIGPIPVGHYWLQRRFNPNFAAPSFFLDPEEETAAKLAVYGRSGFYIHGDNRTGTASRGCIIVERRSREWIEAMTREGHMLPRLRVVAEDSDL